MTQTQQIGVIGAGLMGHGIALTMARTEYSVIVSDPQAATRNSCVGRIADSLRAMACAGYSLVESAELLQLLQLPPFCATPAPMRRHLYCVSDK